MGGGGVLPGAAPAARMALTFDDGPDPAGTPAVLRELDVLGMTATFFVIAPRARRHPELIAQTIAAGHAVGLHCFRHLRHSRLSREELERDTDDALALLAALGVAPRLWRTPWGDLAPWTGAVAGERGLTLAPWTADTRDWRGDCAEDMLANIASDLGPGCVVLMHDGLGPGARRRDCAETVRLLEPLVRAAAA